MAMAIWAVRHGRAITVKREVAGCGVIKSVVLCVCVFFWGSFLRSFARSSPELALPTTDSQRTQRVPGAGCNAFNARAQSTRLASVRLRDRSTLTRSHVQRHLDICAREREGQDGTIIFCSAVSSLRRNAAR
jgi:hypothetical protein